MADATEILTLGERVEYAIAALPTLSREDIPLDDACPICLQGFDVIYEGQAQESTVPHALPNGTDPEEHRGVTKLAGCGHVFCRFDLIEWIRGWHGTCPACRAQFANIRPPSYSEDGSSDGDYVPGEDEDEDMEDDEDGFMDTDGFDAEAEDYDFDADWDEDEGNADLDAMLQDVGLPPEYDFAADLNAFFDARARQLREAGGGRGPPVIDLAADMEAFAEAHAYGRRSEGVEVQEPEIDVAGDVDPSVRVYRRNIRDGSEAEVLRDLVAEAGGDVDLQEAEWDRDEDAAAMENWGLSHSDGDASESLSDSELVASVEDISPQRDAALVAEPDSLPTDLPEPERK